MKRHKLLILSAHNHFLKQNLKNKKKVKNKKTKQITLVTPQINSWPQPLTYVINANINKNILVCALKFTFHLFCPKVLFKNSCQKLNICTF